MSRFMILQTVIILLTAFNIVTWSTNSNNRPRLPQFNMRPRTVKPTFDYEFVISDSQLSSVLQKLHPKFSDRPTKINFIDHALRLWGDAVEFSDGAYSGQQLRDFLLNHDQYQTVWGNRAQPLLQKTVDGIGVATQEGRASVSHVDHLVGTLAEIGVTADFPVVTKSGIGTVKDMIQFGLLNFQLNQKEYEWTALAAAFYCVDGRKWFSSEGQELSYDLLARRIMRQQQPLGVCYGQHRLYTLTMFLRIDSQMQETKLLSPEVRLEIENYLLTMTKRFHRNQSLKGFWDGNWHDLRKKVPDPTTDELSRRILATGHALEWWAMAPKQLHPPRETIVRASQWLTKTIIEMDARTIEKNYTFLTHAARALALWRGRFPAEFYANKPNHEAFIN